MLDFVMRSNKNTSLNPFCFYNRDQTSWSADATLSLHLQSYIFVAAVTLDRLLYNLHRWGGEKEPVGGDMGRMKKGF